MTLCSKSVNAPCQNEATEILYARTLGGEWEKYPRCAVHPAADDVPMIKRFSPLAVTKIVPVPPAADPAATEGDR